jgi:AP-3 complex subunit delta-1
MLGYDMSWAAFWMVEGMALPWFGHKRVAFLAASQCFTPETEVTLLSVHLFKKVRTHFVNESATLIFKSLVL